MLKLKNVVLDTSFLIELADKNKEHHLNAMQYMDLFAKNGAVCWLSSIVVAEYWQDDIMNDFKAFSKYFKYLSYGFREARASGGLMRKYDEIMKLHNDNTHVQIKDDFKIMAHFMCDNNLDAFITKDAKLLKVIEMIGKDEERIAQILTINVSVLPDVFFNIQTPLFKQH
jgi:hypothetical protein